MFINTIFRGKLIIDPLLQLQEKLPIETGYLPRYLTRQFLNNLSATQKYHFDKCGDKYVNKIMKIS